MHIPSMSIELLSSEVVDQIAAGEVVERPAHLVKELVENSLDAGATKIQIEFFDGGRKVKVTDNGYGMSAQDLPKALDRFATSKISQTDDLWRLRSFGFRGEALASISAVSKVTLTSRQASEETAIQLVSLFGRKRVIDKVGGSFGTSILIENLFENTPARLKFLKSDAAESGAIKIALKALALSHFSVEFRVQENGKLIYFWPVCQTRRERVEQVLETRPLFEGEAVRENVKAWAVFADPHHVAKTSKNIWLFAQNRWIQDRSLQAAVMEAYRHLLMHGEYPIAAVWVEADPSAVDVNIHPTKSQVKFENASLAFRAVAGALRSSLELAPWIPAPVVSEEAMPRIEPAAPTENFAFSDQSFSVTQFQRKHLQPSTLGEPKVGYQALVQAGASRESFESLISEGAVFREKEPVSEGYWSSLEVLGQAHLTYIVTQARDKIVFVDQHAAHERVVFEKLMSAWRGGRAEVQDYLFPLAIDMSPEKVEAILTLSSDIARLGVHIETLGPGTLGVKAAPLMIKESSLSPLLDRMAGEVLEQGDSYSLERAVGDICATMACHSVVRAGQALSIEQMRSLLQDMDQFPLSSFCPHGRPVSVEYPFVKLERDFGRLV